MSQAKDPLTDTVIGLAIEVHRHLGPGLLDPVYAECLCHELTLAKAPYHRQALLPLAYEDVQLGTGFPLDVVPEGRSIIEIKAAEKPLPIHETQLLTYLLPSRIPVGLLLNFNSPVLKDGMRRLMLP